MNLKLIAVLITLSMLLAPSYATVSFAQTNSTATSTSSINSSTLNILISSAINGTQTALSHVPTNSTAYRTLSMALSYLKQAQKYYNQGNYNQAEQYFKMAMNESYVGVVSVGKPFSVPPGINVSREQAVEYANKLESEANFITNSTLKSQIMSEIQQAMNELNAGNFTEARGTLGNINAQIHHYVKGRFAVNFEHKFVPKIMKKYEKLEKELEKELNGTAQYAVPFMQAEGLNISAQSFNSTFMQEFNASVQGFNASFMKIAQNFQNESGWQIAQQVRAFNNFSFSNFTAPQWEIGVYRNEVYIEMPYVLPIISIGNSTYVASWNPNHMKPEAPPVQPFFSWSNGMPKFNESEWIVVGVVNSSSAVSYVLSHAGANITMFPPNMNTIMPFGNFKHEHFKSAEVPFQITAEDVGNFSSLPTGIFTVYYIKV